MPFTFHIIYTPGTFPRLGFFVESLLQHSDCHFRLVANGCSLPERQLMRHYCMRSERLSFAVLPTVGMAEHGVALNYLQAVCRDPYFCFMDSDVLATGPFIADFHKSLSEHAAVFSGAPIWATQADRILPDDFRIVSGIHHETHGGKCLGSSYFAIYENQLVSELIRETGVGFQACYWHQVCPSVRSRLEEIGCRKDGYDTGRVLNLLQQCYGKRMTYQDSDALCHIGGYSFVRSSEPAATDNPMLRIMGRLSAGLDHRFRQGYRRFQARRSLKELSAAERRAIVSRRHGRRDPVRQFFYRLLQALLTGQPMPERPVTGNSEVDRKIKWATSEVHRLFRQTRCLVDDSPGRGSVAA